METDRLPRQYGRLHARLCQFCCTRIGKWEAFFGVVNCKRCAFRVASDREPRCTCTYPNCTHQHGMETTK